MDRRTFVGGTVAAALAGTVVACGRDDGGGSEGGGRGEGRGRGRGGDGDGVGAGGGPPVPDGLPARLFGLGVASGDPLPRSVILWTRLVADPLAADGGLGTAAPVPVPVRWELGTDDGLRDVVASGRVTAEPAWGHSVHVDAGGLEPGTWYWYRFTVGDGDDARVSPTGRTRTAPAEGARVRSLRFAFASCQNRQQGFWSAHPHLAEEDLDLVVFLGDYVYEDPPLGGSPGQTHRTPMPVDLPTYRQRWGEYKADAALQAVHRRFPWLVTWDDHEVHNNYADDIPDGFTEDDRLARDAFRLRRAAAYQAFYEHMPLRLQPPEGPDLRLHRELAWGNLARFFVLDTRQHRSNQACTPVVSSSPLCAEAREESRTMLGEDQEDWLDRALARTDATWNVLAQQIVLSALPRPDGAVNLDLWDGYPAARRRLVEQLRQVRNPVVLTGDIHLSAVSAVTGDPDDPTTAPVATELVGTSLSSANPAPARAEERAYAVPHVHYAAARRRGYVVCTVTPDDLRAEFRYVSTVEGPEADIDTGATWWIREGDPAPQEI